jgi:hypothetical protein
MKCFTSYQRQNADTINGETLVVTYRFTTFDVDEMNEFEKDMQTRIGCGVSSEFIRTYLEKESK